MKDINNFIQRRNAVAGGKLELFDCGKIVCLDDGLGGVGVQKFRSDPWLDTSP